MKKALFLIVFLTTLNAFAQSKTEMVASTVKIEMLFPEGKNKALILSYDDGSNHDRKLVQLMNKYPT